MGGNGPRDTGGAWANEAGNISPGVLKAGKNRPKIDEINLDQKQKKESTILEKGGG